MDYIYSPYSICPKKRKAKTLKDSATLINGSTARILWLCGGHEQMLLNCLPVGSETDPGPLQPPSRPITVFGPRPQHPQAAPVRD